MNNRYVVDKPTFDKVLIPEHDVPVPTKNNPISFLK
jgi:hypothetical protein